MKTNKALGEKLLHNLKHAVGYPNFYRNRFCVTVGEKVEEEFELLSAMGLTRRGSYINEGKACYFHVTEAGLEFLRFLYYGNYSENLF